MTEQDDLRALFTLVGASVAAPLLAVRLHLPGPVVLLLAGVLVGPSGLGFVAETPVVGFLSQLGFLVLMFMAGMEIDFDALRAAGARMLRGPLLVVAGAAIVTLLAALLLDLSVLEALVVSATSVGMPLAVLQETGRARTPLGRFVMLTASLGEFACILGIIAFEIASHEHAHGSDAAIGLQVLKVLGLFIVSAACIRFARALVWWWPEPFARLVQHHDVAEMGVRAVLLLMVGFVLLAAFFGVEAILGAFIAGALVAFVLREKHALEGKVAALGHGLFIPLFFVIVGVRFDPRLLDAESVTRAGQLVLLAGLVKTLPSLLFGGSGLRAAERLAGGALLAAPLTLVVAIAAVGRKLGLTSERENASLLLVALLLSVLYPVAFRLLVPRRT